jgi:signal transduction histidine kinase
MKPYSITRRLIVTVLLIELVSALCVTGVALVYERHIHFRSFDVMLRGRADSMLGAVQDAEDANDNVMLDGTEISVPNDDIYEVKDDHGRLLGRSANWAGSALLAGKRSRIDREEPESERFFQLSLNGKDYRIITMQGQRIVDPGDKSGGIRRNVTIYYGSSDKRVWRAVIRSVSFYAGSSLLVLAATGILMSWLLSRGLAPLHGLAHSAAGVSVTSWTFAPPEDARQTRELAPLVRAVESVLGGLQLSFEQQKRFVGDAAHELKTSVAVVKSSLQLLGMKQRTPQEYEAGLDRVLADCARMEAIVAQMLTLARLEETSPAHATLAVSSVSGHIAGVIEELQTMADAGGIAIRLEGDESIHAQIEPEQLQLLCSNLLMNALQHSPEGSSIHVRLESREAQVEICIQDAGEGIHPDDLPHIFERFYRSDPSRSRRTGGTGLGLAICKAIAEHARGSIEIASKVHEGTIVIVRLPIAGLLPS